VLAAMGETEAEHPDVGDPVAIVRPGEALPAPGVVVLEDGTELGRLTHLPDDSPVGYHRWVGAAGAAALLLVPPRRCVLPSRRGWGWAVQGHAARSTGSWGIGDLADVRWLGEWSADSGAAFLLLSPLWASNPSPEPEPSPYFPTTRRFLNPLALRVEEVPGAEALGAELGDLTARGRALNGELRIDRGAVQALKLPALRRVWEVAGRRARDGEMRAFRATAGPALRQWATFVALAQVHGAGWRRWPEELRAPDCAAVRRFAADHADEVAFAEWLQWAADRQLESASRRLPVIGDLPVGVDPEGFDAWTWQACLTADASIGAPPDRFNTDGQDWGLPPFVPRALRAVGYAPFIETVRAAMRHMGGLRIDHALGLFRLWWIPRGELPARGAYVRYPADELLAVLAIESHRSGAFVVGEDLGTVPRGVRGRLHQWGVLGTRLLYFERRRPPDWPRLALAGVTTHDLPTVAGCWTGADLADQAVAGLRPDRAALRRLRTRLRAATGLATDADPRDVIVAAHRAVAASPSLLTVATLEDALAVERRPNIPGTTDAQRANWSMALPKPHEAVAADPFVARLLEALAR
jgi:4-alpha-glucanotransferase